MRGLEPLKKLFWTELNYDRTNSSLPRKGWGELASTALAEDPVLFATGGDDFQVIYARLNSDKLLMGMERPVVSRLLQNHPYALFIFSNTKQDRWHFLNVKYDDDVQRRRLFRRITVGPEDRPYLRTASERLDKINLADASDHAPITIQKLHDDAFDVEPVTKEFFHEYGRIFDEVENSIRGLRDEERKRLFTQRLFNRIMFIAYIQKKGWLKLDGNTDYLSALWRAHQRDNTIEDKNFYRDRLKPLFFLGLNTSNEVNQVGINRGGLLKTLIGEVPYLNGGLFEEDEDDKDSKIVVPDKALDAVLNDLFARFNFTVTESTPLDVEVAVDPEMLGKVFEELVTGRHETGSYYTPKPIVAFMCREALKGYLESQLATEAKQAIEEFVDAHNPANLRNAEAVLEALRRIRVCDPACGSGAYLVGMLHELLDLRACLFVTKKLDAKSAYDRKLEIIQTNLYGVDLDAFAVNIARLRLWLSLSIEYEGQDPPPLPNLDYKVEAGDSVCSANPSGGVEMGFRKALVDEYLKAKSEYMTAHYGQKLALRQKIAKLRVDIASWAHRSAPDFDWTLDFTEVFANTGFDVVLTNPPYVRQELIGGIKSTLEALYPDVYMGTADLYCYFFARGIELLRDGGMMVYISSNKWVRTNYGTKLRAYLAKNCGVKTIVDFGELPVFETAATFPSIFIASRARPTEDTTFVQVGSLNPPYPEMKEVIRQNGWILPKSAITLSNWLLIKNSSALRLAAMDRAGRTLAEYVKGQIYYGIKPGYNDAFILTSEERDGLIKADPACRAVIKPLVFGDEVRRWRIESNNEWIIYAPWDFPIAKYPAIKKHLARFKDQLLARPECKQGRYEWWCLARYAPNYAHMFSKPKIVYPEIAKESRFAFDAKGLYPLKTVFSIPVDDLFLLGILNSSLAWEYLKGICSVLGDAERQGRLTLQEIYLSKLPIPNATGEDQRYISVLAEKCIKLRGQNCGDVEREIDDCVAQLYGISAREDASAARTM
jgi:hypothetical protein